jgi:drug/metabolite transporter (DMT)-like permease
MTSYQVGALLGIVTALCWTGSALAFAEASRRVGSVPVNLIRLVMALLMLTLISAVHRGQPLPLDATPHQAAWLALSGVVGFFIGDLTLFRAFVLIGPRRSTLLMALAPAFAAIADYFAFGTTLIPLQSLGIFITIVGVMWVIVERSKSALQTDEPVSRWGITLGLLGAFGQGVGSVLTSHAFAHGRFDMFASTQIRAAAAIPLFLAFVILTGRSRDTLLAIRNGRAMTFMLIGAFAGPFLGVSLFNGSVARIPAGVTSTLAGMVPIFMIPVAALIQKEHITLRAVLGALIAVAGVALLTLVRHG